MQNGMSIALGLAMIGTGIPAPAQTIQQAQTVDPANPEAGPGPDAGAEPAGPSDSQGAIVIPDNVVLFGKNDPYIGGSSYTQSLGAGGTDQWENQLYVNIGYYF